MRRYKRRYGKRKKSYKRRRISRRRYSRRRGYRSGRSLRRTRFPKVRGFGAYKVQKNTILSGGMSPPVIMNTFTNDGVVLRHREFIGNLVLGGDRQVFGVRKTINLNPGITGDADGPILGLPWLSGIAENWKEYEWHGVLLEYKPLTALATTTGAGAMGTVMIGTHYDMYEGPFTDKQEMLNSEYTTSGKPQLTQIHPIECKRSQNVLSRKWVRTTAVPAGADKRLYDHCRIEIATEGIPGAANDVIGELWLTFEVCLFKPKMVDNRLDQVDASYETFVLTTPANTGTSAHPWFYGCSVQSNQSAQHINENSNMTGQFWPQGIPDDPLPYYRFDGASVQRGDVFRVTITTIAEGGFASIETSLANTYHGCKAFTWYGTEAVGKILCPNAAAGGSTRSQENYLQVLSSTPGPGGKNEPESWYGPYLQWNDTLTFTDSNKPKWYCFIEKITNRPVVD